MRTAIACMRLSEALNTYFEAPAKSKIHLNRLSNILSHLPLSYALTRQLLPVSRGANVQSTDVTDLIYTISGDSSPGGNPIPQPLPPKVRRSARIMSDFLTIPIGLQDLYVSMDYVQ